MLIALIYTLGVLVLVAGAAWAGYTIGFRNGMERGVEETFFAMASGQIRAVAPKPGQLVSLPGTGGGNKPEGNC
jgi:hypothetical protein